MNLVVDANVIFAALIKENITSYLLFNDKLQLFSSDYLFKEIEEHKQEIIQKTYRSSEDFHMLLETLRRRLVLIPLEELVPYVLEAERITPDPDDAVYFALALKLGCAIWSNDRDMKKQAKVEIIHTHELLAFVVK